MTAALNFVDHFPRDPSAKWFESHQKIDAELRNCDSLWPNATMGDLFPGCFGASAGERDLLLAAAMERVEWHCGKHGQQSEKWLLYLTCLLRVVSSRRPAIDDET